GGRVAVDQAAGVHERDGRQIGTAGDVRVQAGGVLIVFVHIRTFHDRLIVLERIADRAVRIRQLVFGGTVRVMRISVVDVQLVAVVLPRNPRIVQRVAY